MLIPDRIVLTKIAPPPINMAVYLLTGNNASADLVSCCIETCREEAAQAMS